MKFELSKLTDYSDEELIREMQRVAKLIDAPWMTGKEFDKHSKVTSSTIHKRFGSWKKGLEKAGLADRFSQNNVNRKIRDSAQGYTNDELLAEIGRVSKILGNQYGRINSNTISRRFGSWSKALKNAGLEGDRRGIRYTEAEYWENLLSVWTHYGRQPNYGEMRHPPSTIKAETYKAKWGTWRKALLAFIEYANADDDNIPASTESQITSTSDDDRTSSPKPLSAKKSRKKISAEDRRDVPLQLRFRVLHRDHFKCVLCGDNPPASPGLILHVDHIVPWSKGGKTQIDNLRTLCAPCNIGRSNKYTD